MAKPNVKWDQAFRAKCAEVLAGVPKEINFPMDGRRISYDGLQQIGKDIMSGELPVRYYDRNNPPEDQFGLSEMPEKFAHDTEVVAMYSYSVNWKRIALTRLLNTSAERAYFVHECVHALIHRQGGSIANRTNEGAAYITEGWYLWRAGFKPRKGDTRTRLAMRAGQIVFVMLNTRRLSDTNKAFAEFKKRHPGRWGERLEKMLKKSYGDLIDNLKRKPEGEEEGDYTNLDQIVSQMSY